MSEFKFKIGEVVRVRESGMRFLVLHRVTIECSGGTQLNYEGRSFLPDARQWGKEADRLVPLKKYTRVHELELEALE